MAIRNRGRKPSLVDVYADEPLDRADPRQDRKTQQLCKQVERTLASVLPECKEELLRELSLLEVRAVAGTSRLEVVLVAPGWRQDELAQIEEGLDRARAYLRAEVAQAIHRKRVPELSFAVIAGGAA